MERRVRPGKKKGGDILQNKKTYLYLKSIELLLPHEVEELKSMYQSNALPDSQKIEKVTKLFDSAFVKIHAEELRNTYRDLALSHLAALGLADGRDATMLQIVEYLNSRNT